MNNNRFGTSIKTVSIIFTSLGRDIQKLNKLQDFVRIDVNKDSVPHLLLRNIKEV